MCNLLYSQGKSHWYPFKRRLSGPWSWSACLRAEKNTHTHTPSYGCRWPYIHFCTRIHLQFSYIHPFPYLSLSLGRHVAKLWQSIVQPQMCFLNQHIGIWPYHKKLERSSVRKDTLQNPRSSHVCHSSPIKQK